MSLPNCCDLFCNRCSRIASPAARSAFFAGASVYSQRKHPRGNFEQSRGYCKQMRWHFTKMSRKEVQQAHFAGIGGSCRVPWR
jgi:hypothetical protein